MAINEYMLPKGKNGIVPGLGDGDDDDDDDRAQKCHLSAHLPVCRAACSCPMPDTSFECHPSTSKQPIHCNDERTCVRVRSQFPGTTIPTRMTMSNGGHLNMSMFKCLYYTIPWLVSSSANHISIVFFSSDNLISFTLPILIYRLRMIHTNQLIDDLW